MTKIECIMLSRYDLQRGLLALMASLVALVLCSCITNDLTEHSLDLSGQYETQSTEQNISLSFEIINQAKKRHDIIIHVTRNEDLKNIEEDFLRTHLGEDGMRSARALFGSAGQSLEMGAQENPRPYDADNISKDYGKSSHFDVCSESHSITNQDKPNENFEIKFCLKGRVSLKKLQDTKGSLRIYIDNIKENAEETFQAQKVLSIPFAAISNNSAVKQFTGVWTGRVDSSSSFEEEEEQEAKEQDKKDDNDDEKETEDSDKKNDFVSRSNPLKGFHSLVTRERDEEFLEILPVSKKIQYNGKEYLFKEDGTQSSYLIEDLVKNPEKLIQFSISFKSNDDEYVSLAIDIRSPGEMTGIILYSPQGDREPYKVGSFVFKKK